MTQDNSWHVLSLIGRNGKCWCFFFFSLLYNLMDNFAFFCWNAIWKQSIGDRAEIGVRTIYIFNRGSQGGSKLWGEGLSFGLVLLPQQSPYPYCTALHLVPTAHSGAFPSLTGLFWAIFTTRPFCFTVTGMEWRATSGVWVQYRLERWGVAGLTSNRQNKN